MANIDHTSKVEYIAEFEGRLGMTFKAVSVYTEQGYDETSCSVVARGEAHAKDGNEIRRNTQINVTVYDGAQRVIGTSSTTVNADEFYGFEAFEISVSVPVPASEVASIKIYPRRW
jgi:hypothetical protein